MLFHLRAWYWESIRFIVVAGTYTHSLHKRKINTDEQFVHCSVVVAAAAAADREEINWQSATPNSDV